MLKACPPTAIDKHLLLLRWFFCSKWLRWRSSRADAVAESGCAQRSREQKGSKLLSWQSLNESPACSVRLAFPEPSGSLPPRPRSPVFHGVGVALHAVPLRHAAPPGCHSLTRRQAFAKAFSRSLSPPRHRRRFDFVRYAGRKTWRFKGKSMSTVVIVVGFW